MSTFLLRTSIVLLMLSVPLESQQPRDHRTAVTAAGTASISGTVLSDDAQRTSLRRARVTLVNSESGDSRTIVTDNTGRFTFVKLAAGRFTVSATKEAHVVMNFGARRPGRPGTSIVVRDGQQVSGLEIQLPRGAVITGVITDAAGGPQPDVRVGLQQYRMVNGVRRLVMTRSDTTDDRGRYRIFGLPPGDYVLLASAGGSPLAQSSPLHLVSEMDVERALNDDGRTAAAPADESREIPSEPQAGVGYASVFYPNVFSAAQATVITVAAAEERVGMDMQIPLVRMGRVTGTIGGGDAAAPNVTPLMLVPADALIGVSGNLRTARQHSDGRFDFPSVAPGEYILSTRANAPGQKTGSVLWASANVLVTAGATTHVALELRPGHTITGRLHFDGKNPPDARGWNVRLVSSATEVTLGVTPGEVQADGTFSVTGVVPGRYRLEVRVPTAVARHWLPVAAAPIDIASDLSGVVITLTDRIAQISGTLTDAAGTPATDYHIIVFPADPALWIPGSGRIQTARPAADGRYVVRPLPAGDYLLSGVIDVEPGEWMDPAFLQRLAGSAMKITVSEGEQKVQDLALTGR